MGIHFSPAVANDTDGHDPEQEALLADSIGPALLIILHTLGLAERVAFVAVPFDEDATIVGRSPAAARQLASRARRRVRGDAPVLDTDVTRQRAVVDAFLAAARNGDFDALLEVLDPDVVVRSDGAGVRMRGAAAVPRRALGALRFAQVSMSVLVNGAVGVVAAVEGKPILLMGLTIRDGKIAAIDTVHDSDRIFELDLTILGTRR